jgi:alkanesulfonate monooxygenase SsuD/methylene tetrahydromethanopterin reductase-like flavin-dependent oxidoreductase (luciferase family)
MTPLGVLDLVPVTSGSDPAEAIRNSIDLARRAEEFGYARYWYAEHHFNPGVAGTSPAVMLALTAPATSTIRLGSGAVQMGHRTPVSVVEEFGLLDAAYPGRFDLGIGRSAGRGKGGSAPPPVAEPHVVDGLLIPRPYDLSRMKDAPIAALGRAFLTLPGAEVPDYAQQVDEVLGLLRGTISSSAGGPVPVVPGRGADVQVWVLGSSAGVSAQSAGRHGLRFAANYHVSPANVLEAVRGYREAFQPGDVSRPYVSISADVVVAKDSQDARSLAVGYPVWVRSIRRGAGAIEFPSPDEARSSSWTPADRELVADRVDTQFVGSPAQVADQLEILREATGADELIVTTITHDHADRVRSFELLAQEWSLRK